jgi:signal transduction histidine kinase
MRERRKLERQNDRMEAVAGVISHDLRTPLDVVDMRLDLAREDPSIEHLDAIARASARIDTLIDDLLTLTRHGTDVGTVEPVDLVSLTESCWRTVATGNATLRIDVGRTVDANPARLRRLLENLLRNAVEHGSTSPHSADRGDAVEHGSTSPRTSSGDAVKHGSASTRTASGDSVAHSATGGRPEADDAVGHGSDGVTVTVGELPDGFYVEDDGPGIPAGDRDRVFEAGYSTVAGGTGLGLSIVTQVADAHGWDVRVTDGVDGGARFEVTGVWPAE